MFGAFAIRSDGKVTATKVIRSPVFLFSENAAMLSLLLTAPKSKPDCPFVFFLFLGNEGSGDQTVYGCRGIPPVIRLPCSRLTASSSILPIEKQPRSQRCIRRPPSRGSKRCAVNRALEALWGRLMPVAGVSSRPQRADRLSRGYGHYLALPDIGGAIY